MSQQIQFVHHGQKAISAGVKVMLPGEKSCVFDPLDIIRAVILLIVAALSSLLNSVNGLH